MRIDPRGREDLQRGRQLLGVSDLEALARDTHKFESRYLDWLIGPYPQDQKIYAERSPINHVDRLSAPVIFFQGAEDQVVPPNQTDLMVDELRAQAASNMDSEKRRTSVAPSMRSYFYAMLILRSGLRF